MGQMPARQPMTSVRFGFPLRSGRARGLSIPPVGTAGDWRGILPDRIAALREPQYRSQQIFEFPHTPAKPSVFIDVCFPGIGDDLGHELPFPLALA
jgi:hypothetical protein